MPRYHVTVDGREFDVAVEYRSERFEAVLDGRSVVIQRHDLGGTRSLLLIDNESVEVDIHSNGNGERSLFMKGMEIPVTIEDYHLAQMRKTAGLTQAVAVESAVKAPMPGLVVGLKVKPGDRVTKGQALVVIEAMKMENIIKAKADATIKNIRVAAGCSVEKGDLLLELAPMAAPDKKTGVER